MEKRKTFVTVFRKSANVHLIKDVGQIPYQMMRLHGYDSTLVSNRNGAYDYLKTETPGLKMEFLKKGKRLGELQFPVMGYLIRNARKIDVLNLYFADVESLVYGLIYKTLNPKGFLYIKLDFNIANFHKYGYFIFSEMKLKKLFFPFLERTFIRVTDLFTIETAAAMNELKRKYPALKNKMTLLPNGLDDDAVKRFGIRPSPYREKENIILTVGRIGTFEKNNEMLLEAVSRIGLKGWKVYFVGPVEKEFRDMLPGYFKARPDLRKKVFFAGAVNDRKKLFGWYVRSKVFCMTSRWEAFSLVLPEAMYFGNYPVLTSTISCAPDVTKNGRLGTVIPPDGVVELASVLQDLIDRPARLTTLSKKIMAHASDNYVWSRITGKLQKEIADRSRFQGKKS